jgi:hypothetical protein
MITPNFFIVGAPKCATSALYNYLKHHPDIFMSESKELNYFATDLTSPHFLNNRQVYLSHFNNAAGYKWVGEASVWYMYSKVAANGIYEMVPDAKIIAMIRNPVDMIYSYHGQRLFNGTEDINNFEKAIEAIPERKLGKHLPNDPYPIEGLFYLDIAKYTEQVRRYINVFGRENIHIIIFDDFKSDSLSSYTSTLNFLGLSANISHELPDDNITRNASKHYKSQFMKKMISNPPKSLSIIGKMIMPNRRIRQNIWRNIKIMNIEWQPRPKLNPEIYLKLQKYYRSEVEDLSQLLDRDLITLWNYV